MRDPFPIPAPAWMIRLVQPLTDYLSLPALALHTHEILFAFLLYHFSCAFVSPFLSSRICPKVYKNLNKRNRLNWDVHVVSFFQSCLICGMAFWLMFYDEERKELRDRDRWEGRIWEYTGAGGLCQSFGMGYFLWDAVLCAWHFDVFGPGMLAHALSALTVFSFGYRPFVNFYAPTFLLYELSSPFLNIHWFCDKLNLTGSIYQAVNGAFLTSTFFGCRLIWGNLNSFYVMLDILRATGTGRTVVTTLETGAPKFYSIETLQAIAQDEQGQRMAFAGSKFVPLWLGAIYLTSNLILNTLNIYWFGKMIQTIRKRFDPPLGTKGVGPDKISYEPHEESRGKTESKVDRSKGSVKAARERAEEATNGTFAHSEEVQTQRATFSESHSNIDVSGQRTVRTRRKA